MEKRGQFYLAVSIVIVAMIIGFVAVSNYFERETNTNLDELREELNIEIEKVYEYGLSQDLTDDEISEHLENLTAIYSNYSELDTHFYFVFGEEDDLTISGYQEEEEEEELIIEGVSGKEEFKFILPRKLYNKSTSLRVSPGEERISLIIDNTKYPFEIKPGKNFHFIVTYDLHGERYVVIK